jgi:hypothetical protein
MNQLVALCADHCSERHWISVPASRSLAYKVNGPVYTPLSLGKFCAQLSLDIRRTLEGCALESKTLLG